MFLRDATVHEYLPPLNQLNGYFAYRGGQSLWWYIERKYGEQKIGDILNRIKSMRNVEAGFRGAIGLGLEEFSERWQKDQKVMYWPDIAKREEPADYSRRLTDHKKSGAFYYGISPAISPQGDKVAFLSNRDDYFAVFIMNAIDGEVTDKLVSGQSTNNFEELKILTPAITWSADGKQVAMATKAGEQDAILIINVETGHQEKLQLGLDGIFSVDWSHQGDKLAFVGNKGPQSDIYVYDLNTKTTRNITDDIYSDSDPTWSPDGKTIFFSSDRGASIGTQKGIVKMMSHDYSQTDLYSIDVATQKIESVVSWPNSDESSTAISPDGEKLLFVSDRNGINNIYLMDLGTKEFRPITNSLAGVYQLSLSYDGSKLAFSSLSHEGYDIFLMRNPFERDIKITELEQSEFFKSRTSQQQSINKHATTVKQEADSTGLYGKDIQIDFSNFATEEGAEDVPAKDSVMATLPKIADNIDENGDYKVNKYKLNFSPDIIYGNAGYNTFYGVQGSTVMAFSDLMGDHQIIFVTNLLLDLKNSDYGLQYYYLPGRIDYGFGGFHSARFVLLDDIYGGSYYRFRTYGANVNASYPVSRFNRIEFGLNWYNISRENLDHFGDPMQRRIVLVPSIGYTHDNSLWGYTAPMNGTRYNVSLFGTPRVGNSGLSFVNITGDYRTYVRLGRNYCIALRYAGGASFGRNPQKFIIGGVDNWINRTFETGYVPLDNAEDYIFLQTGVPLRGYNYVAAIGSRYSLFNFELRYPLFAFLQAGPLPIGLQSIGGVMFFDMGSAWNRERDFVAFSRDAEGRVVSKDLLMGMGTGARIFFLAFLVKFDVAWKWNANAFSSPKYYFSLGADF
ncbi:MAG TPA: biopolymer transporter Tol [Bacteroidetes bacterium]|nr:biopolymer transporter Tol [Bacteroidota bacterium]